MTRRGGRGGRGGRRFGHFRLSAIKFPSLKFGAWNFAALKKNRIALGVALTIALGISGALVVSSCGKPHAKDGLPPGSTNLFADPADSRANANGEMPPKKYELDARGKELLARVADGDTPDVMRFAAYVGAAGLTELARAPDTRAVALAAMAYADDLSCVAVLAEAAKDGTDDDAKIALDALHITAARPRIQADLEDFAELEYTCTTLLAVAKDPDATRSDRARRATSVLRMLGDRGCDLSTLPISTPTPSSSASPSSPSEKDGAL